MDLKHYYAEVATMEETIEGEDVLVVSRPTGDGGKAGVISEVSRQVAARLVVEKKARLATSEEVDYYRLEQSEGHKLRQEAALSQRVQVTLVSEHEWKSLQPRKG